MTKDHSNLLIATSLILFAMTVVPPISFAAANAPAMAVPQGLSIVETKFTGDEFLLLQNNTTSAMDITNYWLTTFNNVNPLTAGVSSSSQQLPSVVLLPGQTLLLSSVPMQTCGASVAGKLSVTLTDGGGFLQLTQSSINASGAVAQSAGDFVSWSSGANGVIQNVPSSTKSPRAAYYRYFKTGSFFWQQADLDTTDGCQLNIVVAGGTGSSSVVTPLTLAATSPPATILGTVELVDGAAIAVLPAADIGLTAPQISELLPNPVGTGNDATDEYIELYNPNTKPFDLTGFTLQSGLTSLKAYIFPEGSMLEPGSFKAFSSTDTKLTLSNTSSQVGLLDPFGNVIASSDVYKNAKDGIGWASAKGSWFWTTKLTPGAANIIQQPAVKKAKTTKTKTKAKTKILSTKSASGVNAVAAPNANSHDETAITSQVHFWILALVGGSALLYGAYEYRRDLAIRLQQLRRKFSFGTKARAKTTGQGSD